MTDALGSIKEAYGLAKDLLEVRDAIAQAGKIRELQSLILQAQENALASNQERATLVQKISNLEAKIAELEAWEAEKKRYELKEFAAGQFAYILKPEAAAGEPAHKLCANCYNRGEKAILQTEVRNPGRHTVTFCQNCNTDLFATETGGRGQPAAMAAGAWASGKPGR